MNNRNQASFNFSGIAAFVMLVLFFAALFLIVQGIFTILLYASPVLLAVALIYDYQGTFNFGKWIFKQVQKNIIPSLIAIALAAFFWKISVPAISTFLFLKAMFKKKLRDFQKEHEEKVEGEYIEYEEVNKERKQPNLELPPLKKRNTQSQKNNEYDNFFE